MLRNEIDKKLMAKLKMFDEIDKMIYIKLHKYSNEIEGYYDGILFYKYLLLKKRTYYQISYSPKIITKYKN